MHIFRDMSVWVIARHIALTGCKLECRKTGGGSHEHASRFRPKKQRRGSRVFLEDMDVPSFLPILCILVSYYRVCTARWKDFYTSFLSHFSHEIDVMILQYVLLLSTRKIVSILRLAWRINYFTNRMINSRINFNISR